MRCAATGVAICPANGQKIQRQLRAGEIKLVVSTNALELGVDIGSLTACLLCGYPGTIASTWQQAGRAGRRNETALTIMVASSAPIDQYIVGHPGVFYVAIAGACAFASR